VVDLHAVTFIDSAGLGLLVRAHQEAKQHDGTFALAAPSRFVLTVLHTMRLDGVFRTFPDRRAALAGIHASDAPAANRGDPARRRRPDDRLA
jgi:anti-anti-sigma regulatory factor